MHKPKKKRSKSYRPRDVFTPGIIHDLLRGPNLTAAERTLLDELIAGALDKVQLSSFDLKAYRTLDTTCQHLEALSPLFNNAESNARLAFFCRCLIKALWVDMERPDEERIIASRRELRLYMIRALEHLLETLRPMYDQCSREELRQLERSLDERHRKQKQFVYPNAWAILPHDDEDKTVPPFIGWSFLHESVRHGRMTLEGKTIFFVQDDGTKIRVTDPCILVVDPKFEQPE